MDSLSRFVGLDVHKGSIVIAVAEAGRESAQVFGTVTYEEGQIEKALRKLGAPRSMLCCYEAGPTGYGLYRRLNAAGISCRVIAPSLTPIRGGSRIKTDRRDAATLAHFLRSGDLTTVVVPDEETESVRDLVRARQAAKKAERTARHHLQKFLLRHGRRFVGGRSWTQRHLQWIRGQEFVRAAHQRVMRDYLLTVERAGERIENLDKDLAEIVADWTSKPLVRALMAFRGVDLLTASAIVAELGTMKRFATARELMAYVGLVPSEHSSGERCRRGSITKTGNQHVRRLLVEAAWSYRFPPRMSKVIRQRNEGVPEPVQAIAWKAQRRLHRRLVRLTHHGKSYPKAVTAVARELAGFLWSAGQVIES